MSLGWYLYLRRCHRCQRPGLESGVPHVLLSLTRLLPSSHILLPSSTKRGNQRQFLEKERGVEGLDSSLSISSIYPPKLDAQTCELKLWAQRLRVCLAQARPSASGKNETRQSKQKVVLNAKYDPGLKIYIKGQFSPRTPRSYGVSGSSSTVYPLFPSQIFFLGWNPGNWPLSLGACRRKM